MEIKLYAVTNYTNGTHYSNLLHFQYISYIK
jgi:hypothetical protein